MILQVSAYFWHLYPIRSVFLFLSDVVATKQDDIEARFSWENHTCLNGTQSHGGSVQTIFLKQLGASRFQPFVFRGVKSKKK